MTDDPQKTPTKCQNTHDSSAWSTENEIALIKSSRREIDTERPFLHRETAAITRNTRA